MQDLCPLFVVVAASGAFKRRKWMVNLGEAEHADKIRPADSEGGQLSNLLLRRNCETK